MESSQKIRILTSIDDWDNIQILSRMIWDTLKDGIQNNQLTDTLRLISIFEEDFPKKIHFETKDSNDKYEWIVSNMGSVTLRPLDGKHNPILYFSLTKYSDQSFEWEDELGNRVEPNDWLQMLNQAIHNHRFFQK